VPELLGHVEQLEGHQQALAARAGARRRALAQLQDPAGSPKNRLGRRSGASDTTDTVTVDARMQRLSTAENPSHYSCKSYGSNYILCV
jgi:hypothetical protein